MAFLDKNDRVFDVILTEDGIKALSKGNLRYAYFVAFDDQIDYDPVISNSSSLSAESLLDERAKQIEETPLFEAFVIQTPESRKDIVQSLVLSSSLYDAADGYRIIPQFVSDQTGSFSIEIQQQTVEDKNYRTYRGKSTAVNIIGKIEGDVEQSSISDGFEIEVFLSGSDGLVKLERLEDRSGFVRFNDEITIIPDRETGFGGSRKWVENQETLINSIVKNL